MLYSVAFFALSAQAFADEMKGARVKLLEKTRRWLKRQLKENPAALKPILAAAEGICRGKVPKDAPQEYFDALFALVNVFGERLQLAGYEDFNEHGWLEDVGIWPFTQKEAPPFPMPRSKQGLPQFGFMSAGLMREVVLPGLAALPPFPEDPRSQPSVRLARNQFHEIVESVAGDGLDLVAHFSVW